ncbi:MAG: GAF domain-containing protein [Anaerolineales bacterium]|nr:GAF domain-containing protein [Anaerolineales bacterium]
MAANTAVSTQQQLLPIFMQDKAIPETDLHHIYDRVAYDHLALFALIVGFVHTILAAGFALLLDTPLNFIMAILSVVVAAIAILVWLGLRIRPIPTHWSHPILAGLTLLALINSLAYVRLSGEVRQTMFVFFIVLGSAQFFLSSRWFFFVLSAIFVGWAGVIWQMSGSSIYFGSILLIGGIIAAIMFYVRRRSITQYELLRIQDEQRKQSLQHYAHQLETSLAGEKSARYLAETLQDTGRALASTLDWDGVMDLILEKLGGIVSYDRAGVLVKRDNVLEMVAARGFPTGYDPLQVRIQLDNEKIYSEIDKTKRSLSILDVQERSDWRQNDALQSPRSWLGVPLIKNDQVTGMLSLARETVRPYTDEEIELATAFAGQAVIALDNARMYEETTRFNQQLEYEVHHRTEAIRTAYEQLEHLNRSKSDFISIVSHELRTPVTILSGYSQMLAKEQIIQTNEMLNHLAAGMQSGAVRLEEIINSMLDVAKIDNQELRIYRGAVSIPAMIRVSSIDFAPALKNRQIELVIEEMSHIPTIQADSDALQKVFFHLITNAIKYTPDGGRITISCRLVSGQVLGLADKEAVEVVVADTGIGVDPAMHELIFDKFYQTGKVSLHSSSKTMFKGGGPGLGLAVCRGIVAAHRGKLWVESTCHNEETCPGSRFLMVLPILEEGEW